MAFTKEKDLPPGKILLNRFDENRNKAPENEYLADAEILINPHVIGNTSSASTKHWLAHIEIDAKRIAFDTYAPADKTPRVWNELLEDPELMKSPDNIQTNLFDTAANMPASEVDVIGIHRRIYAKLSPPFVWIFSMSLHRYFDRFYGFDIVKFDEDNFEYSEDETLASKIEKRYGRAGVSLIELLISKPSNMAAWLDGPEGTLDHEAFWQSHEKGSLTFK